VTPGMIALGISVATLVILLYVLWKLQSMWDLFKAVLIRQDAMRIRMGATHEELNDISIGELMERSKKDP